jgi:hypothetical protein
MDGLPAGHRRVGHGDPGETLGSPWQPLAISPCGTYLVFIWDPEIVQTKIAVVSLNLLGTPIFVNAVEVAELAARRSGEEESPLHAVHRHGRLDTLGEKGCEKINRATLWVAISTQRKGVAVRVEARPQYNRVVSTFRRTTNG